MKDLYMRKIKFYLVKEPIGGHTKSKINYRTIFKHHFLSWEIVKL